MSYLECNKCGGYYELQEGESPDNFSDTCECGGKLKYKELVGPDDSDWRIDIKAVLVGIIVTYFLASFIFRGNQYALLSYLAPAVGGFLTAYISNGGRTKRIFNSIFVMIIVGIIILVSMIINEFINYPFIISYINVLDFASKVIMLLWPLFLSFTIIGTVMGYVAVIIKDRLFKTKTNKRRELHPLIMIILIIIIGFFIFPLLAGPLIGLLLYALMIAGPSYGTYIFVIFFGALIAIIIGLLWFIFRKK